MIFDKFVDITIKGKTYKLCFPMKYVWEAERHLMDRSFAELMRNVSTGKLPAIGDVYIIFKYAILGGNANLKEEDVDELFLQAVDDNSSSEIFRAAFTALEKSGAIGKQKKEPAAPKA